MSFAYFRPDGSLLCIQEEDAAPEGAAFSDEVPFGTDPNSIWFDAGLGSSVLRQPATLALPRPYLACDDTDAVLLTDLPDPCTLSINGNSVDVAGGSYELTTVEPGPLVVALTHRHHSELKVVEALPAAVIRDRLQAQIDAAAELCRNKVVTPGSGQAMTYIRKAEAARRYLDGEPLQGPALQRITDEATRLGVTETEAAQALVDIADAWETLDATIDNIRLTSKKAVSEAGTIAEADAIIKSLTWPI